MKCLNGENGQNYSSCIQLTRLSSRISGFFTANTLLSPLEYYTLKRTIRKVNLLALQKRFSKIILRDNIDKDIAKSFVSFRKSRDLPTSIFDNYHWRSFELPIYSFYNYLKTITIVKDKIKLCDDKSFTTDHSN